MVGVVTQNLKCVAASLSEENKVGERKGERKGCESLIYKGTEKE